MPRAQHLHKRVHRRLHTHTRPISQTRCFLGPYSCLAPKVWLELHTYTHIPHQPDALFGSLLFTLATMAASLRVFCSDELNKRGTCMQAADWSDLLSSAHLTITSAPPTTSEACPAPFTAYVHMGPLLRAVVPKAAVKATAAAATATAKDAGLTGAAALAGPHAEGPGGDVPAGAAAAGKLVGGDHERARDAGRGSIAQARPTKSTSVQGSAEMRGRQGGRGAKAGEGGVNHLPVDGTGARGAGSSRRAGSGAPHRAVSEQVVGAGRPQGGARAAPLGHARAGRGSSDSGKGMEAGAPGGRACKQGQGSRVCRRPDSPGGKSNGGGALGAWSVAEGSRGPDTCPHSELSSPREASTQLHHAGVQGRLAAKSVCVRALGARVQRFVCPVGMPRV